MTDRAPVTRVSARRPRISPAPVVMGSLALFLVALTFLTIQVRNGRDPSLGRGTAIAAVPKRVLIRRIERRVVIEHIKPAPVAAAPAATGAAPAASTAAPVTAAAPAYVPPAPTYTPAPAPAPAPVVTKTS